ncbi:MAG TPA: protease pro-enzyme activation domain-containing protein, partial [Myxococcota bacterium]|nr:protease pro-enzyme activation domain-containing protein [Myxococcota bacterium]
MVPDASRFTRLCAAVAALLGPVACGRGDVLHLSRVDGPHLLADHVPARVATAVPQGPVAADEALDLRVALPLQNEAELDALLVELYDPKSPLFGRYLTPEAFHERFQAGREQVEEVRQALAAYGLIAERDAHGSLLSVRGAAQDVERFFSTRLVRFADADGATFFAPQVALEVPAGLPIRGVLGIASGTPRQSHMILPPKSAGKFSPQALPGAFTAADIRKVYDIPAGATGKGQVMGLVELDGYLASDIAAYAQRNGIPNVPTFNILLGGVTGAVVVPAAQGEVTLDIELMMALAP